MPTASPPKTSKGSWLDWLPSEERQDAMADAEPLLTRDELVADLQRLGHEVTARDLIFWQTKGVVPYPVREKRRGRSVAVYPRWMPQIIHILKGLQEQGYALREIAPLMRDVVAQTFAYPPTPKQTRRLAQRALYPIADELDPLLHSLARVHELIHGGHITHVELRLVGDDGVEETYLFPTTEIRNEQG